MSYCRFVDARVQARRAEVWARLKELDPATFTGDGVPELCDVYLYDSDRGITCCGCVLDTMFTTGSRTAMIEHLLDHRAHNHRVPERVLDGIREGQSRDLLAELGHEAMIRQKVSRCRLAPAGSSSAPTSWHNRGFGKLATCTERRTRVIEGFIALANAAVIVRRLLRTAWTTHSRATRLHRRP